MATLELYNSQTQQLYSVCTHSKYLLNTYLSDHKQKSHLFLTTEWVSLRLQSLQLGQFEGKLHIYDQSELTVCAILGSCDLFADTIFLRNLYLCVVEIIGGRIQRLEYMSANCCNVESSTWRYECKCWTENIWILENHNEIRFLIRCSVFELSISHDQTQVDVFRYNFH